MQTESPLKSDLLNTMYVRLDTAKTASEVFAALTAWLKLRIVLPDELATAATFALRRLDARYNNLSIEPYMTRFRIVVELRRR